MQATRQNVLVVLLLLTSCALLAFFVSKLFRFHNQTNILFNGETIAVLSCCGGCVILAFICWHDKMFPRIAEFLHSPLLPLIQPKPQQLRIETVVASNEYHDSLV